ncbi:hypothetical protein FB451DRAFT_1177774 [Mycena latifolia]|nr:hypothetical protein FB451DRAFT_1177774 [Mycena latifolia]
MSASPPSEMRLFAPYAEKKGLEGLDDCCWGHVWVILKPWSWNPKLNSNSYLYSFGVYENFYALKYLNNHSPSSIAYADMSAVVVHPNCQLYRWIGSFQLMMPFALGLVSGKLFDKGHFYALEITGGLIFTLSFVFRSFWVIVL